MNFFIKLITLSILTLNLYSQSDVNTFIEPKLTKEEQLEEYKDELAVIDVRFDEENAWMKSYSEHLIYLDTKKELLQLQREVKKLSQQKTTTERLDEIDSLKAKKKILSEQILLFKGENKTPFAKLLAPEDIGEVPDITNPFDIISGMSFIKALNITYDEYMEREEELSFIITLMVEQKKVYDQIKKLTNSTNSYNDVKKINSKLEKFQRAYDTVQSASGVYKKRIDTIVQDLNQQIKIQTYKLFNISIIIGVIIVLFVLARVLVKKYITDNDRFYMANKGISFVNFTLIFLIIIFNYIDSAGSLTTILGFASAGIAIAMKDWFMSVLGWLVIVFGGSIHVGDRIRVDMDGMKYVGDVMDISLLRITLLEDITLTSYNENRRAGRIIFIPNNYIFTRMIASYTHDSLKTVWDGIDITITFDSNHQKALHLAKEITRKYSKGYTEITRKQLNKLRNKYNLKNTNVEPRIFSFIEDNGMRISSWYLTNAYATLTLRSTISADIVDAFNDADDIMIAYPTQRIHLQNEKPRTPPSELENANQKSLF
ncbi:MAG: mechanosensitive ion channel [Helicobacteraceae bacterium]|nr:mechanosensitive ion channel [Helicobacteraceae bacterium]